MLFKVEMTVRLPATMPAADAEALKKTEREVAQGLMRQGTWRHLWRVAGRYANVSIFDVDIGRNGAIIGPVLGGTLMGMAVPLPVNFLAFALPGAAACVAMTVFAWESRLAGRASGLAVSGPRAGAIVA